MHYLPPLQAGFTLRQPSGSPASYAVAPEDLGEGAASTIDVYLMPTDIAWTADQVEKIQRFASSGGGIVVAGNGADMGGPCGAYDAPINAVMRPFGLMLGTEIETATTNYKSDYFGWVLGRAWQRGSSSSATMYPLAQLCLGGHGRGAAQQLKRHPLRTCWHS